MSLEYPSAEELPNGQRNIKSNPQSTTYSFAVRLLGFSNSNYVRKGVSSVVADSDDDLGSAQHAE